MSYIMVDIESDGPIPGDYSMICFGAVIVNTDLSKTFYGKLKPISDKYINDALKVSGFSREQTLNFDDPKEVLLKFENWIKENCTDKPIFISDNNGFDWMFICWYFHHFLERNPFGYSSMNLGSFYKGVVKNVFENFKHLRKTVHTHNPVDDAKGNAEAFLSIIENNNIKIKL
ncbi:MAG TPA: 3'-5' exoribonuclease [Spirochaetota bacterium]|nr:3'-5' exoribonuclease [Spirochaetota bacterium]HOS32280.1 3'-5' exoribonuclease [Spirochaetota bacterium]HOS55692.1 3'-5' exoribonuclease [Spirochaetota bacterium]HPK61729.1 3'-5' exoribonuclease [Spirochaetota bacterium]HQF78060.1 3'-5' exoribonuclease [Spirochaetota bacterium]